MFPGEPMNEWDIASFDWPIGPDAVVIEAGGYAGRWLTGMASRYRGTYHAFDPQGWAIDRLEERWQQTVANGSTLYAHRFGLGLRDETLPMRGWGTDANSFLMDDAYFEANPGEGRRDAGMGELRDAVAVLNERDFPRIDVLMSNIEGYEFPLFPYLIERGVIDRVRFIAIQFHSAHDPDGSKEQAIRAALARTHDIRFDYGLVLAGWSRRA